MIACPPSPLWQLPITLGTALHRMTATSFVLADVSLSQHDAIQRMVPNLLRGPSLLAANNLVKGLVSAPGRPAGERAQDQSVLQLLLGTRGSFTAAHTHFYGADAYLHLLEGRKLWFVAPPEHGDGFRQLFKFNVPSATYSKKRADEYLAHGVQAVVQEAGDTVFIPGGWHHCVKNLSDSVAFGASYIRAWHLQHTLDYMEEVGEEVARSQFNIDGIFDAVQDGYWGISTTEGSKIQTRWKKLCKKWKVVAHQTEQEAKAAHDARERASAAAAASAACVCAAAPRDHACDQS